MLAFQLVVRVVRVGESFISQRNLFFPSIQLKLAPSAQIPCQAHKGTNLTL
jgi:hypothetical protein